MFVYPEQIAEVMSRHPEVARWQAVVTKADNGADDFRVRVEAANGATIAEDRIAEALRGLIRLRAEIDVVEPGTIPDDAKRLDDLRA